MSDSPAAPQLLHSIEHAVWRILQYRPGPKICVPIPREDTIGGIVVGLICLVIGILGFVKGRINVSRTRELRGAGMYVVATLFCLPLPLSFLVGVCLGVVHAANRTPLDSSTILIANVVTAWLPLIVAIVLAFVMAKPKELHPTLPLASGFPVLPPTPPGPPGPTGAPMP